MKKLAGHLHLLSASRWIFMILLFLLPLFFLPITLEPLELNKQTLLVLVVCVSALCWLGSMLLERKIRLRRGWVNILPWFFSFAFIFPALYSVSPFISWVGAHRQEYTSVLTAVSVAVLFYVLANIMGERKQHQVVHMVLIVSTTLTAGLALCEVFGMRLLASIVPSLTLNTVGTLMSLTTFLVVMNSFFLGSFIAHKAGDSLLHNGMIGIVEKGLIFLISLATFFFLLLLDDGGLWMLFSGSLAVIFIFVVFRAKDFLSHRRLFWLMALLLGSLCFWFVFPGITSISIPLEVTPNTAGSMDVAQRSLQATSSSYGSGPGTYALDYSQFHDASLNQTDFWNVRFDRASSFILTLVPTIGVFGVTLLGLFVFMLFVRSLQQVVRPASRDQWLESFVHLTPWLVLVGSAFVVPWNMTLMVSFGIFSGLLASQTMRETWKRPLNESPAVHLLVSAVFIVLSFGFLIGIFLTTGRYIAENAFSQAVQLDRKGDELKKIVTLLDRATVLNGYHDTYYRNLGEALLLRADEELKGVTSLDTLTPESAQYLQALTAASVNAVARATELSPYNALNWLSRGFVYRELIPVLGEAADFTIASFLRATELDPQNPANWTELGEAYLAVAEHVQPLTMSPDNEISSQVKEKQESLLLDAEKAFTKAVELKPNYAPAHFQLAMTYQRQNRSSDAIMKLESISKYNQQDVGVLYQLGVLYLQRDQEGDFVRAQNAFEQTITLVPSYSNAHWFLASIYEDSGDIASAVTEVEKVLELNPENELVKSRLQRLINGQISTELPEAIEE